MGWKQVSRLMRRELDSLSVVTEMLSIPMNGVASDHSTRVEGYGTRGRTRSTIQPPGSCLTELVQPNA